MCSAQAFLGQEAPRELQIMALRLREDRNHYVSTQDVYNLRLLGCHFGETDCFKHVLPYLGWRMLSPSCSVATDWYSTWAISENRQLVSIGGRGQCNVPPDLGPVVAVAAGGGHTCAVKASGELFCFGENGDGQCDVPPDLGPVVVAAAGEYHTCAVKASGELASFGDTGCYQRHVPADLGPVMAVATAVWHTCAVKKRGELPPDLGPILAVAAEAYHTCTVKASGELVCFRENGRGQCNVPPDLGPVVAVAAGHYHTCAVKASGQLLCFGSNADAQCDVPAGFNVLLAARSSSAPTPDPTQEVIQHVQLSEPAADISEVRPAPQAIRAPTPDPAQDVIQNVHHDEPPANIPPTEAREIVPQQEASLIEAEFDLWPRVQPKLGGHAATQQPAEFDVWRTSNYPAACRV